MRARAFDLVKWAIEDLNKELEYDSLENLTVDTPLFGGPDGIDSLSLVRLVVILEQEAEKTFGRSVTLADEKAMSMRFSPFRTVGSLTDLVVTRLEGADA